MDGSTVSVLSGFNGKRSGVCPVWPVRNPVRFRSLYGKYPVPRNASDAADVWKHVQTNVCVLGRRGGRPTVQKMKINENPIHKNMIQLRYRTEGEKKIHNSVY